MYLEGLSSYEFILFSDRHSRSLQKVTSVKRILEESFLSGPPVPID